MPHTAESLAIAAFSAWVPYALLVSALQHIPHLTSPNYRWLLLVPLKLLIFVHLVLAVWSASLPTVYRYDVFKCGLSEASLENLVNPDIGGIGVVFGLFTNCFAIAVVLIFGHIKSETSGVKELCIAQLYSKSRCC
jgi:hypothetical protein